jgi:nucleoid-associated protein YejK
MGLDQYAGFRDEEGRVKEEFYWRKHARLQKFMAVEFKDQNKKTDKENNSINDLQHLGFNGGQGGVKITKDLLERLEEAYKNNYYDYFASDGFFWGQQFQEEQVTEYKEQDKKFIDWCKEQLNAGKDIAYDCSW